MPEVTKSQKGWIGERLVTEYSYLNPNAHLSLFKLIAEHIEDNFSNKLERCDGFTMKILSERDNLTYKSDGEFQGVRWNYTKGEPETNEKGLITNNDKLSTWIADAVIAVEFSKNNESESLETFYKVEYPLEINTGSSNIRGNQREAFIHADKILESKPFIIKVDISNLPESYEMTLREYKKDKNQIRKIERDLSEPSEEFKDKNIR